MTTYPQQAPSGAPTHSLRVWSDGTRIYVEIPGMPGKDAYITSYSFDSRGVGLMLSLLGLHRIDYDYHGTIPDSYVKGEGTAQQQAEAEALLFHMGLPLARSQTRK